MEPDYKSYSWEDLLDTERHINPEAAPENFARLQEEIERRRPVEERKLEEDRQHQQQALANAYREALRKKDRLRPVVAYLQLSTAATYAFFAIGALDAGSGWLSVGVPAPFIVLNAAAGYYLLKDLPVGYWLTAVNAVLQLPDFIMGGVQYSYRGLGGVYAHIASTGEFGIAFTLMPGFNASIGDFPLWRISIDFVAVAILVILYPAPPEDWGLETANSFIQPPPASRPDAADN